jgi:CubicO group peptidase (beta-lactamase class C family)
MNRRQLMLGMSGAGLAACGPKSTGRDVVGFTDSGLAELEQVLKRHVAQGSAPGLVAKVARGEADHVLAIGTMTLGGAEPVRRDTLFRLASMTKPVTAAAVLMLVEDGKLRLDEPVDRLLPELANRRVLRRIDGPLDDTVPAKRPITVEDVLTFRLGWGVLFDDSPIARATADLPGFGMPNPASPLIPDTYMAELAKLPLMAQPGERWLYTAGSNVLGVLVERASGRSLPEFFRERIFEPLGMSDTGFYVPAEKAARLITGYMPQDGKLVAFEPWNGLYAKPPSLPAGDSGLVSSIDDYGSFAWFLEHGWRPGGKPMLSPRSIKAMRVNRLTPAQRKGGAEILGPSRGWGYGVGVYVEPSPEGVPRGAYGWDGGFGTSWFNDPKSGLIAILLTQRVFDGPDPPQVHKDFWKASLAALA